MRWHEAVSLLRPGEERSVAGPTIDGIAFDSRRVEPGDLFVALRGTRLDGHAFVAEAVANGAIAAIVEHPVAEVSVPQLVVHDAHEALARLSHAFYGEPSQKLNVIGVTGTAGKTSTAYLMAALIAGAGHNVGIVGSLGIRFGETFWPARHTTPDPPTLCRTFRAMLDAGVTHVVMEVSTHGILQHRVTGVRFRHGVFTNLHDHEHTDIHPTFAHYVETKRAFIPMIDPGGTLVYNADEPLVRSLAGDHVGPHLSFAMHAAADIRAAGVHIERFATRFDLTLRAAGPEGRGVRRRLRTKLLGAHNVTNILAAVGGARAVGMPLDGLRASLSAVEPLRRRMELVHHGRIAILDDTVGNPASVDALFRTVASLGFGRIHLAYAVRGSRGVEVNMANAERLAYWAGLLPIETIAVTACVGDVASLDRVIPAEREAVLGTLAAAQVPARFYPRLKEAIEHVLQRAADGDLVILFGAQGMDQGAALARRWLAGNEPSGDRVDGGRGGRILGEV